MLAPTRELAVQIEDQVQGLTYHTTVSSVAVYGGVPMDMQERALRAGVDIVVATPGRLMDHMRHDSTDFTGLEVLVLDEADRMLDMGFWPDVQRILAALPAVAPDAAVLGDDAGGSAEADAGVPARAEVRAGGTPRRPGADDLARRADDGRRARRRSGWRAGCVTKRSARCWSSAAPRSAPSGWRSA